ncbi:MAG TPA: hypothetical protein VIM57_11195 [Luteolibacter sp.]
MHQIDSHQFPDPATLNRIYDSDGLWLAHCSGPFYYLGTRDVIWGLTTLLGGYLKAVACNGSHNAENFLTFCDIANQDDGLMVAALFDQRSREQDTQASPFPVSPRD